MLDARNGREGLEKAAAEKPDLIVMDIMMEEMDGLSALRELKHTEATRGIPVIIPDKRPLPEAGRARSPRPRARRCS